MLSPGTQGIDAAIRRDHLDVAEAVGTRDIEQRVLVVGDDMAKHADHVARPALALGLLRRSPDGRSQEQRSHHGGSDGEVPSPKPHLAPFYAGPLSTGASARLPQSVQEPS